MTTVSVGKTLEGEKRDFGAEQKLLQKMLDKAQRICDTTAHETSERKNNTCLLKCEITVSHGTLTTEEWKAEQQLEPSEYTNQFLSIRSHIIPMWRPQ
ncbi:hypothetical protein KDK_47860 [Dictyobacter kobayashii]|uniref:Uncharacterized protein n=1 Tax=Dictyobacter kobayashii TaxID=2014872 RepID=A0A402APE6_9CHLR|nr:hypothetical protein KDK_47860 [Dictyobacter kobayashii]